MWCVERCFGAFFSVLLLIKLDKKRIKCNNKIISYIIMNQYVFPEV